MKKGIKKLLFISMLIVLLTLCACSDKNDNKGESQLSNSDNKNPIVTIEMEDGGIIKAELYPEIAPNTVNNFISLINKGYYDGVIFHRVIPGFMIQGGDPQGTGRGGPGYKIKGEFTNNGFTNNLKHTRGVLSMARQGNPYNPKSAYDTAGSQFFIMVADAPHLDKDYASFGKVIEGMDVVDRIVSVNRNASDKPLKDQRMKKVTVETFGVSYPEPETIKE
ncbi:MAG: peptidylprolyl isomerase [Clostridiales bacterium]|jgi:peptidyl-prolyl cis-trans isomerase B (cyclophilin B)|nr:peptidylprolyl isomerase [Clostridiales bacterium]